MCASSLHILYYSLLLYTLVLAFCIAFIYLIYVYIFVFFFKWNSFAFIIVSALHMPIRNSQFASAAVILLR